MRAVLELRHPVKTARRGGVGTPIGQAGARMLVSRPAISCRDPKRFEPTIATRGSRGRGDYCCVTVVAASSSHRRFFEWRWYLTPFYFFKPPDKPVWVHTVRFNRPLQPSASTNRLRARAACFPRFRGPIVGTKAVIQNSRTVGGKQQATFAGYFDRLDSFIEAIRHSQASITLPI